jgi:glyoxylase-like metal-dependent hydrolase (beta-lactamase superfamily II)
MFAKTREERMDRIEVPEDQIIPLEDIAPGILGLRIVFVNVFAISHPDNSWTLIDTALPFAAPVIRRWAERRFHSPPKAIVLTHGHFDHVGAARELAEAWNVSIYAHQLEFPYLTGKQEYPAPNPASGGGLLSLLSPLYPRGPLDLGSRLLAIKPGGLAGMPRWQVLHTPGHTAGHISLFRPQDRVLIAGDAFCTTKPESFFQAALTLKAELHGPPAYFTSDWEQARTSVRYLAALGPTTLVPGHGRPLRGEGVTEELQRLADDFDRVAVPKDERRSVA